VASRGAARNRMFGKHGNRPPGTTTCAARSSLHALRRQCRSRKRGPGAQKPPRWSAERRASYVISAFTRVLRRTTGREAPRKRLVCRVMCRPDGVFSAHSVRLSALRPPLGWEFSFKTRAQSRRGNALGCLTSEDVKAVLAERMRPRSASALDRPHAEEDRSAGKHIGFSTFGSAAIRLEACGRPSRAAVASRL
jgi:hypothetical protein